jgi:hypothetical protein
VAAESDDILLTFFRTLADEQRLKLLGALAWGERGLDELATLSGRKEREVARDLERLQTLGLVEIADAGPPRRFRFNGVALRALNRQLLTRPAQPVPDAADALTRSVLTNFLDGERIKELPAGQTKRQIVLAWLAERFESGKRFPEREVNELIQRHHPDYAWLRRELVDNRFMQREGGVYWRVEGNA